MIRCLLPNLGKGLGRSQGYRRFEAFFAANGLQTAVDMAVASSAAVDHALARLAVATEDHLVSFLRSKLPQLSASNQNSLSLGDPVVIILPVFLKAVHNFANVRESVFILGSNQRSGKLYRRTI